jgi:hypothetical protein
MADQQRWIVTLSKDHSWNDVERELKSTGFEIDEALKEIGVIVGRGAKGAAARIRAIPGVTDVERETPIDIGPPGSGPTW